MKPLALSLALAALTGCSATAQESVEAPAAEVLVLGTWHMSNVNADYGDVLSPQHQAEIAEVIDVLRAFRPTKIAVESYFNRRTAQDRYAAYLAGDRELARNETDQLGYRLARELGHEAVYPVDVFGDFPSPRLVKFVEATGRDEEYEAYQADLNEWLEARSKYAASHTILETLLRMNSEEQVSKEVGLYYQQAAISEPWDWAGPDLLADWFRRNMRIYGNITHLIDSPEERVLVIYGAGHLGWLQQAFESNPDIELRRLGDLVE